MPTPELDPAGRTLTAIMAGTSLPVPATRTAMRRIGRQRGPLTRRIAAKGVGRSADATWVACPEPGHRSGGSGAAHDRAGASPAAADGGRGGRRDLELGAFRSPPRTSRFRHCRPSILCRRAGTIRGTSARRPPIISRASGSRIECVVHPAHHDERDGGRRARADASARGAGESRPRGDHDGRQRAAANRAGRDAGRHRDGDDGAVVPAADVRGAEGEVAGAPAARPRQGPARHRARAQDQPRVRGGLHDRPQRRDGARAVVARLPDRSARHVLQELLGQRRRRRARSATSATCARTWAGRSEPRRRTRPPTSSCSCCAAACCGATRTRSSI